MTAVIESILNKSKNIQSSNSVSIDGKVSQVVGLVIEATGPQNAVGSLCNIHSQNGSLVRAEIVGFKENKILLMPLDETVGIVPGARVTSSPQQLTVPVGPELKGRVLDGLGNPIDDLGKLNCKEKYPVFNTPPDPLKRKRIDSQLSTGIRSIDGLIPIANGQRVGIFAGSGVGKSVTMGMIARNTSAEINVIALIGERGREVREFIENDLGKEGMKRSVLVVATSDQAPYIRLKAALVATTIAEYFRDCGKNVLLIMDSLTRVAHARREIGLALGEQPTSKGYPPSVISLIPSLIERTGSGELGKGSITSFYTILADGDDHNDPVVDTSRAILDGHIMLSRDQAQLGIYPAIDIQNSISRVMDDIVSDDHKQLSRELTRIVSVYKESRDLVLMGGYSKGQDKSIDEAHEIWPKIVNFMKQDNSEKDTFEGSLQKLKALLEKSKPNVK